jgi:lysozyme
MIAPQPLARDVCRAGRAGRQRAVLAAFCIGAVLVIASLVAIGGGWWTPTPEGYTEGVDVSAHQGRIDWDVVSRANVRFAYIKASEGATFVDARFAANWSGAASAGIRRGAYHRFSLCRSAEAQAANFIRTVPRTRDALPPAVDVEDMSSCGAAGAPNATALIESFLDLLEAHYGARPILYVTQQFHDAHAGEFSRERFWIRSLYAPPSFRRNDWVLWQHHNFARRPGINGPVDVDAFRGDEAALTRFAQADEPTT